MPLTKLDPIAALVVIDLQKGVVSLLTAHPMADVIQHAGELARAFRERGLPVVLVNVSGRAPGRTDAGFPKMAFPADWTELVPELEPHANDILTTKQRIGAFIGTSLHDVLQERRVTQIFLAGVATSMGVESTARSAHDYGYNVVFVVDGMTDLDAEAHRVALEKIFPRLGESCKTEDVLKQFDASAAKRSS